MATSERVNAKKDGIIDNNRPSSPEGSEGQNEDVVLGIDLSYGPGNRRKHWKAGIKIHTDLYCQYYKEDITCNNYKCQAYKPIRTILVTTQPKKCNGYHGRDELMISCSNCHHSINKGIRFKRI